MSTALLLAVPSVTSVATVVKACEALAGPLAIAIESHRSEQRKLRWFSIYGCGDRAVESSLRTLLEVVPGLTVATSEDTTEYACVYTVKKTKRALVQKLLAKDDGAVVTVLQKRYSKSDATAFVTGVAVAYGEKATGWTFYGRTEGRLARDAAVADEVDISGSAFDWEELDDWVPGDEEPEPERAPQSTKSSKTDQLTRSLKPTKLDSTHAGDAYRWTCSSTPIYWKRVDAAGLIGESQPEVGTTYYAVVWSTDRERTLATPLVGLTRSDVVAGRLLADDRYVFAFSKDTLLRADRADGGHVETLAKAPWFYGASSWTQDRDHLYFFAGDTVHRVPKRGGTHTVLSQIDEASATTFGMVNGESFLGVTVGPDREGRVFIAQLSKRDGTLRKLRAITSCRGFVASGDTLFWFEQSDENLLFAAVGDRVSEIRVADRIRALYIDGDRVLAVAWNGKTRVVCAVTSDAVAPIGTFPAAPDGFAPTTIVGDIIYGHDSWDTKAVSGYRIVR